jgi:hypothetical protein
MTREVQYTYSSTYDRYDHSLYFVQDSLFRFFIYNSWYNVEYVA